MPITQEKLHQIANHLPQHLTYSNPCQMKRRNNKQLLLDKFTRSYGMRPYFYSLKMSCYPVASMLLAHFMLHATGIIWSLLHEPPLC